MKYISVFSEIRCVTIFIYSYKCFAKLQKKCVCSSKQQCYHRRYYLKNGWLLNSIDFFFFIVLQCRPKTYGGKPAQSCKMSIYLNRAIISNQILPKEKCVNRNKFNTSIEQIWYKRLLMENKYWKYYYKRMVLGQNFILVAEFIHTSTQLSRAACSPTLFTQSFNIFTQIYLPYLWHFATLNLL